MKNFLIAVIAIVVLVGGYLFFTQSGKNQDQEQIKVNVTQTPTQAESPTGAMKDASVQELMVIAKQWEFQPATIRIKEGDKVRLKIKSVDVSHGFAIPEFDVNVTLEPQKETVVEFIANKKGEFIFFCTVVCGQGHKDMKGKLVVE